MEELYQNHEKMPDLECENFCSEENCEEQQNCAEPVFNKKRMKKDVARAGWGLIIYMVILYGIVLIDMVRRVVFEMVGNGGVMTDEQIEALGLAASESAVSMIIGVSVATFVLYLYMSRKVDAKTMLQEKKPMNGKLFWKYLSVFMAVQLIFSWFAEGLEMLLNLFGYTAMASIEAASSSSNTVSMFIYASFVAPVVEELVYRGIILGALRKYGKIFAIVISALLFGIMHGNIPQAVFAFFVGLVLGFVAEEYSLKWAILIHIINNFVFAELIGLFGKVFGEGVEITLNVIVIYGFFAVGAAVLWKNKGHLKNYLQEHRTEGKLYVYALTTLPVLLFVVVNFLIGLLGIQPL